jgi:hypothetical protein
MTIETELKPCPLCDGEARIEVFKGQYFANGEAHLWVCSNNQKFGGMCPDQTAYVSADDWNNRPTPSPEAGDAVPVDAIAFLDVAMAIEPPTYRAAWSTVRTALTRTSPQPDQETVERIARIIDAEAFGDFAAKCERDNPHSLWPQRRDWARRSASKVLATLGGEVEKLVEQARLKALDDAIELCAELSDCTPSFIADRIRALSTPSEQEADRG